MAISLKVGHHYKQRNGDCVVIVRNDEDGTADPFAGICLEDKEGSWWRADGGYFVGSLAGQECGSDIVEDLGPYEGWEELRDEYL